MDARIKKEEPLEAADQGMAAVVNRNIAALLERRQLEERAKGSQERIADAITAFTMSQVEKEAVEKEAVEKEAVEKEIEKNKE